jgi:hypothetical protein
MLTEQNHINNHSGHRLTTREQQILFSPFRLVVVLALCIFTTEVLVMVFFGQYTGTPSGD